jgi:DNA invertase Pin-like site-specific DNA recombinase
LILGPHEAWSASEVRRGRAQRARPRRRCADRQFLDLSTSIGKGILAFLSALAQDERERILKRSKDGLKLPRRAGSCGRPPALNDYQREEAARRLPDGESARSVARLLGVSHVTVAKLRVA